MPFSNWLHNVAVRGCLIAGVLVQLLDPTLGQTQQPITQVRPAEASNQNKQPSNTPTPAVAVPKQQQTAAQQKTLCDEPEAPNEDKTGPRSDICQQWRMAGAAEQQVYWTKALYDLTWFEIGALALTLLATACAAVAASQAARAAQKSADAIPNIERAYVFFWDVERDDRTYKLGDGRTTTLLSDRRIVVYKNCGKTPAIITKTRLNCDVFAEPPIPQTAPEKELPSGAIIDAGGGWPRGKVSVTKEKIERAKAEDATIYLYGEITYRDIFKKEQRSWFCRRWNGKQFVLGDLNDEKLNGYT